MNALIRNDDQRANGVVREAVSPRRRRRRRRPPRAACPARCSRADRARRVRRISARARRRRASSRTRGSRARGAPCARARRSAPRGLGRAATTRALAQRAETPRGRRLPAAAGSIPAVSAAAAAAAERDLVLVVHDAHVREPLRLEIQHRVRRVSRRRVSRGDGRVRRRVIPPRHAPRERERLRAVHQRRQSAAAVADAAVERVGERAAERVGGERGVEDDGEHLKLVSSGRDGGFVPSRASLARVALAGLRATRRVRGGVRGFSSPDLVALRRLARAFGVLLGRSARPLTVGVETFSLARVRRVVASLRDVPEPSPRVVVGGRGGGASASAPEIRRARGERARGVRRDDSQIPAAALAVDRASLDAARRAASRRRERDAARARGRAPRALRRRRVVVAVDEADDVRHRPRRARRAVAVESSRCALSKTSAVARPVDDWSG
eukprot:30886-Pelagococcus_subviridis.AAC.16